MTYPLIIEIALYVSVFAVIFTTVVVLVIYFHRQRVKTRRKREEVAEQVILEELSEHVLVYDSITDIPKPELNDVLSRLREVSSRGRLYGEVLIRVLLGFRLNLSGAITRIINATYTRLRLRELTLSKLRDRAWWIRIRGLIEVREMHDGHSLATVAALVSDPNLDVRVSAYAALLELRQQKPFAFMEGEQEMLTPWHRICLLDAIYKSHLENVPEFKTWLGSGNSSIVLLCITLVVHFNQLNATPGCSRCLAIRTKRFAGMPLSHSASSTARKRPNGCKNTTQTKRLPIKRRSLWHSERSGGTAALTLSVTSSLAPPNSC